jgi:hypothetical protein
MSKEQVVPDDAAIVEAIRERMRLADSWSGHTGYKPADYFDTMMDLRRLMGVIDRRTPDASREALEALTKERDDEKRRVAEQISEMGTLRFRAEKAEAALAEMKASREAEQRFNPPDASFVALSHYRQADEEGVMVTVSRQAIDEVVAWYDGWVKSLTAPAQKPEEK